jgi:hypothetical protein
LFPREAGAGHQLLDQVLDVGRFGHDGSPLPGTQHNRGRRVRHEVTGGHVGMSGPERTDSYPVRQLTIVPMESGGAQPPGPRA